MGRVSWLARSAVQKFLRFQTICVESSSNVPRFQRAFVHSAISGNMSGYVGNILHSEPLSSKRFVHATGVCLSRERDHYEILGISKDAGRDEIKKAFHALAKKYHPDVNKNNPSAKRKFQAIRDAYETLMDRKKKAQYDSMREHSGRPENVENSDREEEHFKYAHRTQFSDSFHKIFSEIFENESGSMGTDIQVELALSFSEAAKGCTKYLSFDADVPCDTCNGRGHPLDAKSRICPTCRGVGRVTIPPFATTCSTCKGHGRIIKEYCMECRGSGVCKGTKEARVTIPAGVDSGDTIRVPGAGNAGGWGKSHGNLLIKLKVEENFVFRREGADIYVDCHISFTKAILGGHVEVPTLSGKVKLKIPKGVQPGQSVLLRRKGLLAQSGYPMDYGDQHVRFCIKFPLNVTERQRAILEELEMEGIYENTSTEASWWQHWIERVIAPKHILELSILMAILLFLNKILN